MPRSSSRGTQRAGRKDRAYAVFRSRGLSADRVPQFACHLASCARMFSTPKTRRLHLISAHGFPKEYFFAVTNKGFGGLLRKWGEGASMLRGTWKPREGEGGDDDDEGDDENVSDAMEEEGPSTSAKIATNGKLKPAGPVAAPLPVKAAESSVDALASSMSSLSLVPSSVRFGRGGKSGGLAPPRGHPRGGAPVSRPAPAQATSTTTHSPPPHTKGEEALPSSTAREDAMNEDTSPSVARPQPHVPKDPRGRGRGRGRGGGFRGGVARGFVPPPPRGGFLAATRGRAVALSRGRGRGLA
ncbi:hypothetical protein BV25DRAFT_1831191 [Artomyces pyxidatus]|uniref:Uncharacterized protein n=1 Tax=Artomyces pyxidatus TaxID=48021 RepID=A0ACB8SLF8_9AGAM|nr:hypothetical protein BV25DRAFT_1831191 [Artomyces pyxidatus]